MPTDKLQIGPAILDDLYDSLYVVDLDRRIIYWNRAAEKLTGYSREEVLGRRCSDNLLNHVDEEGNQLCIAACPLAKTIEEGKAREAEVFLHHKSGHRVPVLARISPVRSGQDGITGAVEVFNDSTTRRAVRQRLQELEEMAMLDTLTKLPNRRYLSNEISSRLEEQKRTGRSFGLLFLDLDHFKEINDTYGHEMGDKVLKMVSRTLDNNSRPYDTMGRWGGDEFVGVVPNVDAENLNMVAQRYRALVAQSALFRGDKAIGVTLSVGATISHSDDTLESVLKRADKNVYRAKEEGRNRLIFV